MIPIHMPKRKSEKKYLPSFKFNSHKKTVDIIGFPFLTQLHKIEEGLSRVLPVAVWGVIGITASLLYVFEAKAWEISTHQELTEKAIEFLAPDLNAYLVDNLGLESGLNTSVNGFFVISSGIHWFDVL